MNRFVKIDPNGAYDQTVLSNIGTGFNGNVASFEYVSDEEIYVGGTFSVFNSINSPRLICITKDGFVNNSFDTKNGFNNSILSIKKQSDGKILIGGAYTTFTGTTHNRLVRLFSNGTLDTSFNIGSGFNNAVTCLAIQSDGKILVAGAYTTFTGTTHNRLVRLNANGTLDTSFNVGTGFDNAVNSILIQSDGKILVGGTFQTFTGTSQNRILVMSLTTFFLMVIK
jgi:uncharacterized delta-60 repeat protein